MIGKPSALTDLTQAALLAVRVPAKLTEQQEDTTSEAGEDGGVFHLLTFAMAVASGEQPLAEGDDCDVLPEKPRPAQFRVDNGG